MNGFSVHTTFRSLLGVMALCVMGCHGLLDVSNPTLIQDQDIANATGANSRRLDAVYNFTRFFGYAASEVSFFTDETMYDFYYPPGTPNADYTLNLDRRDTAYLASQAVANGDDPHLTSLDRAFANSSVALNAMLAYGIEPLRGEYLTQLYALRSALILQMAEDICSGFPINDISTDNVSVYSGPYTTDSATKYALAEADSALAHGHDSTQFLNLAQVLKGRALLDLGQYAQAAAAVTTVPTSFTYTTDPGQSNPFLNFQYGPLGGVGEHEGQNGLPFVSANDPRVPSQFFQTRQTVPTDSLYFQHKYLNSTDPIVIASGVEARLIEAEAVVNAGDPNWLTILNTLRTTVGLGPLPDPGTTSAQIDLVYSERAFWLYLTGRRLGDMRRLVRNYGRDPETVFPTGNYPIGGYRYATGTAIPFTVAVEGRYNPHITTGCASQ